MFNESGLAIYQMCVNPNCGFRYDINSLLFSCLQCGCNLQYIFEGHYSGKREERDDLWKNFELLPLENKENIISLGAGNSEIIELPELSGEVNGANIFLMCDMFKNPTGTFKDREASIIMSRCSELGLDNLVFYSTANTGRAYTHYAAHLGLTTYMFMPRQCAYKNTAFINKGTNNYIIYVNDHYPEIAPFAKAFAKTNGLTLIAPMHDRTESYATMAYEQLEKLPECNYFVQTIASGMGPIGFYKGHLNLLKLGIQDQEKIPRIVCIQSSETNVMSSAYNQGVPMLSKEHLPNDFVDDMFEPTLNSTNPINNYPQLCNTLKENNGIITDVDQDFTLKYGLSIAKCLAKRGLNMQIHLEKSLLIEYAGIRKLALQGQFRKGENILLLACGRGNDNVKEIIQPDATINVKDSDPKEFFDKLKTLTMRDRL